MFLSISTKIFFTKVYKTSNSFIFTAWHRKGSGPVMLVCVKEGASRHLKEWERVLQNFQNVFFLRTDT